MKNRKKLTITATSGEKVFKYSKRRVTDLPENNRVTLPKETTPKIENELGMLREIVMREFHKLKGELEEDEKRRKVPVEKRKNQEGRNLTKQQREGLKKLKKRIGDKEVIVLKTDKSGKITLADREKYLAMGRKLNEKDKKIKKEELRIMERKINEHCKMWTKITNAGEAHGHNQRIKNSK